MVKVKELEIQSDAEFMSKVVKRRTYIERVTITISIFFFINATITFALLEFIGRQTEKYGTEAYLLIYAENIVVMLVILIVFNRNKF